MLLALVDSIEDQGEDRGRYVRLTTAFEKHRAPIGFALKGIRLASAKATRGADIVTLFCVDRKCLPVEMR